MDRGPGSDMTARDLLRARILKVSGEFETTEFRTKQAKCLGNKLVRFSRGEK